MQIGNMVYYRLSEDDADRINKRIEDARASLKVHQDNSDGTVIHVGNSAHANDVCPMIVARVNDEGGEHESVNGQVILDGNHTFWATSRTLGSEPGQFSLTPRVEPAPEPIHEE